MLKSSPATPQPSRRAQRGFALLMTITLLAFLVVLLVGLAAYTRVETAISTNTQRQAQARQNALMALSVAVGQLQKYAGPDQSVTATADAFGGVSGAKHFTGVWPSDPTLTTTPATPVTWLVSGNELLSNGTAVPLAVTPASSFTSTNSVELVGKNTSGTASDVLARLMPVTSVGFPGSTAATTIGRYAWWVGDQGVKAPVALADPTSNAANFNYAPYTSAELLSRIRQQISLGAGAADATGAVVFEPRDTIGSPTNVAMTANTTATSQLAFFRKASGQVGLATLQQNYHTWSANNFNVLANTSPSPANIGLRQDLSLYSPSGTASPLGAAFDAWANYTGYLEDPNNPTTPSPLPAFSNDPLRRRYTITPPQSDSAVFSIAPVLSFLGLGFSINNDAAASTTSLQVTARAVIGLWNPYSSALVPPDGSGLQIRIHKLPQIQVQVTSKVAGQQAVTVLPVNLVDPTADTFTINLPWTSDGQEPDKSSWLPGRVYNWAMSSGTGYVASSDFYDRTEIQSGSGQILASGVRYDADNGAQTTISSSVVGSFSLTVDLVRISDNAVLATYTLPPYQLSPTTVKDPSVVGPGDDFAFVYWLAEHEDLDGSGNTWLTAPQRDPRNPNLGASLNSFTYGPQGNEAAAYTSIPVSSPDRLLDRLPASMTYDEDVPVFELPRSPLLSVGSLQHLQLSGTRPFAVGNSWGEAAQLNGINTGALFDRFFFSGLTSGVTPVTVGGSLVLPNPLLKPLPRNASTGVAVTLADLQNAGNQQPSKFLMQGGAFNLNSTNATAWAAVLRGVRFPETPGFTYLDADPTSGTAADTATASVSPSSNAQFLRFAQSAQETYKAEAGNSGGAANTQLFRQGMRTPPLTATQVYTLATSIVSLIKSHQAANGPFRTLEEFLSPASTGNPSLLEQAISDAGINSSVAEFSSQWLTQADIMTALAPVLFARSDTFVIRGYGEAVNPTTGVTEGKAWCEATVQRVPAYFDPTDPEETAPAALTSTINQTLGRRFKIISFRWLTRSDI